MANERPTIVDALKQGMVAMFVDSAGAWWPKWLRCDANGNALVSTSAPRQIITPEIRTASGGTSADGTVVVVDAAAAAGSQHIQVSGDVEADVLNELVGFVFDDADNVQSVLIGLLTEPSSTSEALKLAITINGDVVSDATILYNQTNDILYIPLNVIAKIPSTGVNITRVGCIAKTSGLTKTANSILEIVCIGLGGV